MHRHFQAQLEVADLAQMFSSDAAPPIARPPFDGGHKFLDGAPLHVGEHFLD